jgi:hypothetical protein
MEIIDEETGFNDKTYEMQLKKVRHLRIPEKPDILMTSQVGNELYIKNKNMRKRV